MQEEIKNGLKTIGTPLLALVLVFSLVAMPVAAALSIPNTGMTLDYNSASDTTYVDVTDAGYESALGPLDVPYMEVIGVWQTVPLTAGNNAVVDTVVVEHLGQYTGAATDYENATIRVEDAADSTNAIEKIVPVLPDGQTSDTLTFDVSTLNADSVIIVANPGYSTTDSAYAQMRLWTTDITTASTNTAPVADAGADQSVVAGDTVTFDGSASSDADSDALTYSWDFDADGVEDATGAAPTYTYATAGSYTVDLTVSDGTDSATDSMVVTVGEANTPPVIDSGLVPDTNISATVNESVSFDASNSTDADSDELTYSWDFDGDDAEDSANATATYTYDTAGTYDVSLTVSDGTDSVTETYSVVVEEASEEPVGGGSADDGISTEAILVLLGTFIFAVAVGVAVRRIA